MHTLNAHSFSAVAEIFLGHWLLQSLGGCDLAAVGKASSVQCPSSSRPVTPGQDVPGRERDTVTLPSSQSGGGISCVLELSVPSSVSVPSL